MITVTVYVTPDNPACDRVLEMLQTLEESNPHQAVVIDVTKEEALVGLYENRVPVVQVGPYRLEGEMTVERLKVAIGAASDRINQLQKIDNQSYQERLGKGHNVTDGDRLSLWISKNYIHVFNVLIFLYVGLPFLAPVLEKVGAGLPAGLIYRMYSIVCHQLPFRSWILFCEQTYYPRAMAGIPGVLTYEDITNNAELNVFNDRWFVGNESVGYKVALCQRDVAIYGAMVIFGIGFALSGRKIRSIPWYLWVILGLGPIGLDGFSQLPSVMGNLPAWLPIRESNPLFRSITGVLFGVLTTWYLYPMIEATMLETRRLVTRKQAVVDQTKTPVR
ncbi:MAG: DUF2085 domain-containing protein [Anaerolineae bacterium]|nr:DUF2085 domain-containing protein [Anaerolineae bacterium]